MKALIAGFVISLGLTTNAIANSIPQNQYEVYIGTGVYLGSDDSDGLNSLLGFRYEITHHIKADISYIASGSLNLFKIKTEEEKIKVEDHDAISLTLGYFHPINKRHELFIAGGYLNADVDYIEEAGIFRDTKNKSDGSYHIKAGWQMTFNNNVTLGAQFGSYEVLDKNINNLHFTLGYKF